MQYGYRMGKAALNIAGATLARDLKSHSVSVALIHPGVVCYGPLLPAADLMLTNAQS